MRPDLIASRYNGLSTGRSILYSFEEQSGVPVDGSYAIARNLSPFTLRLVLPDSWKDLERSSNARDVSLLGRAALTVEQQNSQAQSNQSNYRKTPVATSTVGVASQGQPGALEQFYTSGADLINASGFATRNPVLSDANTARDISSQLAKMRSVPPLTLLVNPSTFTRTYTTVQKFTDRSRFGFIFDRWGEGQVTASISGSTGAFIAGAGVIPDTPTGVQYASKRNSAAFQNFLSLYHFYRNNGYIYDTVNRTEAHLAVGAIAIDYDQFTYVGHIESFTYTYDSTKPHNIDWSMEFTIDRLYDLSGQPLAVTQLSNPNGVPAQTQTPAPIPSDVSQSQTRYQESRIYAQTPFTALVGRK
jgi:hypothetical protein